MIDVTDNDFNTSFTNLIKQNNYKINNTIIEELRNNYNLSDNKINILLVLFKNNINLFETINLDFVKNNYFELLNIEVLKLLTSIEPVQKDLLKLSDKKLNIFLSLISNYANTYYWPPYFNSLLHNLTSNKFEQLIN